MSSRIEARYHRAAAAFPALHGIRLPARSGNIAIAGLQVPAERASPKPTETR